jgi:hypothetical protein
MASPCASAKVYTSTESANKPPPKPLSYKGKFCHTSRQALFDNVSPRTASGLAGWLVDKNPPKSVAGAFSAFS